MTITMHWLLLLAKLKTKEVERNQRVNLISQCTDIQIQIQYGQRNAKSKDSKFTFFSRKRFWFPWNWEKEERGVREDWIRLRRDTWNLSCLFPYFVFLVRKRTERYALMEEVLQGCSVPDLGFVRSKFSDFLFSFLSFSF